MQVSVHLTRFATAALPALVASAVILAGSSWTQAQTLDTRLAIEVQFRDWLRQTVWPDAQRQGVSQVTFEHSYAKVTLNRDLPELQPPGGASPHMTNAKPSSRARDAISPRPSLPPLRCAATNSSAGGPPHSTGSSGAMAYCGKSSSRSREGDRISAMSQHGGKP